MTGFGRASLDASYGRLTVEIQSLNRKHLEVSVSLADEFAPFEYDVRKWVGEAVSRGSVSVRISLEPTPNALDQLLPDANLLKRLKKSWDQVAKKAGLSAKEINLPFLMQYLPSSKIKGSIGPLQVCVKEAIEGLLAMKTAEGQALAKDLKHRLRELERMLADVQKHSPDATQKMRTRLHDKIAEVMQVGPELEERLLREVALFAERVDIAEEITRFLSHTEQFQQLLKGDLVGRKMDFLLQEMNREVNTIGSKSMDVNITRLVVSMKSELEKMREQVQNIE